MRNIFLVIVLLISCIDSNAQYTRRYGSSSSSNNPMGHSRVQDRINSHRSHRTHGFSNNNNNTFENSGRGFSGHHGFNTNSRQSAFSWHSAGFGSHNHYGNSHSSGNITSNGSLHSKYSSESGRGNRSKYSSGKSVTGKQTDYNNRHHIHGKSAGASRH